MDAIQFLKQAHQEAKQMFQRIEGAAGHDERGQLWKKLEPELKAHEQMEEQHLYGPVARDVGSRETTLPRWAEHHREEVAEAESVIEEINGLDPSDTEWLTQVKALKATLEHHIEEEEQKIWPKIQQTWDRPKLEQAGKAMEAMKAKPRTRRLM